MTVATRWITAEQFAADRAFERGYYLLNGEAIRDMGNAHSEHEHWKAALHALLIALLAKAGIRGTVFSDTSYRFNDLTVLAPDVSVQIPSRKPIPHDYYDGSPEIAIEIFSPSNSPRELDEKAKVYWTSGARAVWVFDPPARQAFQITATGDWLPAAHLEACGLVLDVAEIWPA